MKSPRYPVPAGVNRREVTVRRSRFVATVGPASDERQAEALLDSVRAEFPDATHHCWAFVAGPPGDTARIGMSDAGEPRGTAGRPILNALLHSGVGDAAAVVTRYYGGTKLGRGGLARAYAAAVAAALETLPQEERVRRVEVALELEYAALEPVRRVLDELGALRLEEDFAGSVRVRAAVPADRVEPLRRAVAELTGGRGGVRTVDDPPAPG